MDKETKLILAADPARLIQGFQRAGAEMKKFKSDSTSLIGGFSSGWKSVAALVGGGLSIAGLYAFTRSTLDAQENMVKLSQKMGISIDTLKVLKYSAALADLDMEKLAAGVGILSKNMAGAAVDMGGSQAAFKALGLEVKDSNGNLKSADVMLGELSGKFAAMEDGTGKTALAMALFGISGKEMIPFLNQGAEALAETRKEMEALGFTFNAEGTKKAEELNDNIKRLEMAMGNLKTRAVMALVPSLLELSEQMLRTSKDTEGFKDAADTAASGMKLLLSWAVGTAAAFDLVGTSAGEAAARAKIAWDDSGNLARATGWAHSRAIGSALFGGIGDDKSALEKKLQGYGDLIEAFWKDVEKRTSGKKKGTGKDDAPLMDPNKAQSIKDQFEKWAASVENLNPRLDQTGKEMNSLNQEADRFIKTGGSAVTKKQVEDVRELGKAYLWEANIRKEAANWESILLSARTDERKQEEEMAALRYTNLTAELNMENQLLSKQMEIDVYYGRATDEEALTRKYEGEKRILELQIAQIREMIKIKGLDDEASFFADQELIKMNQQIAALEKQIAGRRQLLGVDVAEAAVNREKEAYDTLKYFAAGYHLFREQQLDRLAQKWRAANIEEVDIARWKTDELRKLAIETFDFQLKYAETYTDALAAGLAKNLLESKSMYQVMAESSLEAFHDIKKTGSDALFDALTDDLKTFADYWETTWKSLARRGSDILAEMGERYLLYGEAGFMGGAGSKGLNLDTAGGLLGILKKGYNRLGGAGSPEGSAISYADVMNADESAAWGYEIEDAASGFASIVDGSGANLETYLSSAGSDFLTKTIESGTFFADTMMKVAAGMAATINMIYSAAGGEGALLGGLGGIMGLLGGSGAAAGGGTLIGGLTLEEAAMAGVMVAHKGGTVGKTSFPTRMVPLAIFQDAPKFRTGYNPATEFPAILHKHEEVLSPEESVEYRAGASRAITIPITLTLDGKVVATQVFRYEKQIKQDRRDRY
jgi:hypothetical protein